MAVRSVSYKVKDASREQRQPQLKTASGCLMHPSTHRRNRPTLLAKLPQLPKEVRYRFVGRNMLLVDRESNVIIDYMPDALP